MSSPPVYGPDVALLLLRSAVSALRASGLHFVWNSSSSLNIFHSHSACLVRARCLFGASVPQEPANQLGVFFVVAAPELLVQRGQFLGNALDAGLPTRLMTLSAGT